MCYLKTANRRVLSIVGFSLIFSYLLSFLFEGQVLYSLLDYYSVDASGYIFISIMAHFAGLFSCGYFVKSPTSVRLMMLGGMGICLLATVPFFFAPSALWAIGLIVSAYTSGCSLAAWGYFLKAFTPKGQRIKSCADVLIWSNVLMIAINVTARQFSALLGLTLSMLFVAAGMVFIWALPVGAKEDCRKKTERRLQADIKRPLAMLFLFVAVITINSGLMYQVINPAFDHLTGLVSWYWAVPYIIALAFMRNFPIKAKRSQILYVGIGMMIASFICFMLLGRKSADYLLVDTLMLGACGIFDLFWWSILGEMLEFTENPTWVFGVGLSSNVFGVLCGGVLGVLVTSVGLTDAEVTVIALTVICVTLVLLPPLNRQLILLLKNHAYLAAYSKMNQTQQADVIRKMRVLEELTVREKEVLEQILSGKSNREVAQTLSISESTVKTHARNIFSKYDVGSRAELISTLLKNQADS